MQDFADVEETLQFHSPAFVYQNYRLSPCWIYFSHLVNIHALEEEMQIEL